jgi:hypothetical protein
VNTVYKSEDGLASGPTAEPWIDICTNFENAPFDANTCARAAVRPTIPPTVPNPCKGAFFYDPAIQ